MALTDNHPSWSALTTTWQKMRDTYAGEEAVKAAGQTYLPATGGQIVDKVDVVDSVGYKSYQAYKARSIFPTTTEDTVINFLGLMHSKPPEIKLPAAMEKLRAKATVEGEGLEQLLRRINEEQLVTGRLGLLADLPEKLSTDISPYIVLYTTERVTNWDNGKVDDPTVQKLEMVVLNESELERKKDSFTWVQTEKRRVLKLIEGEYRQALFSTSNGGTLDYDEALLKAPVIRGKAAAEIPFVFCNSVDILPSPLRPPLLGVANLALGIYRGEADYRQSLHMQGQQTLVIIGGSDEEVRVGANAAIHVSVGGDAKYIGVSADGLAEQRNALENDKKSAAVKGGQMLDNSSKEKESGDALRIRIGARATTLVNVAKNGAFALQEILRMIARWMGLNDQEVVVKANEEFVAETLAGQDLAQIQTAKQLGAKISDKSVHALMRRRNMTTMTYEEEIAAIEEEPPMVIAGADDNGAGPNNRPGGGPGNTGE